jgi:1,4-dihydroxy-2-naphthoate octaprenyltransferase
MNENNGKKSFAYRCGQAVSAVLWGCLTSCLIAIMIAATLKFITILF